jgi:putative YhbY family RNA-binding protein
VWEAYEDSAEAEEKSERMSKPLTAGKKRFVKRALSKERPAVMIGKCGASDEILKEIGKQLDKNKMVKVKVLKTGLGGCEIKSLASEIAAKSESFLVEVRGHTFMLYKPRQK